MAIPDPEFALTTNPSARRIERYAAWALALAVALGTLLRNLGRWHWMLELTTHFVVQATILSAMAAVLLLVRRFRRLSTFVAVLTLVNASEWVFYHVPTTWGTRAISSEQALVVASVNVLSGNRRVDDVRLWLTENQVEVVFLSEVDPWWADQIATWKDEWPHQIAHPRSDNFGLALISRYPLSDTEVFHLDGLDPAVRVRVTTESQQWTIVGLHPFPPAGKQYSELRNMQLESAAKRMGALQGPRVVLGDLNCTSSSPFFRDFLTSTGLRDSRQGFGWQPSWPAGNTLLRIPIDHCLVDPEIEVLERSIGPDVGSDHLPVKAVLRVHSRSPD